MTVFLLLWFALGAVIGVIVQKSLFGIITGGVGAWFALLIVYALYGVFGLVKGAAAGEMGAGVSGHQIQAVLAALVLALVVLGPRYLSGKTFFLSLGALIVVVGALSYGARNKL